MMWFLLLLLHIAHIELVISKVEDKLILRNGKNGSNPCEGYLEVYHKNAWGYVGDTHWSKNTEKVVCKSTHCGEPVENSAIDLVTDKLSKHSTIWLNELTCKGNESSLWDCHHPGWNASYFSNNILKKLKCSSNITISLDGSKCAGAVQYSIDSKPPGYFCGDSIGKKEANLLCESLRCGGLKEMPQWMASERFRKSTKMKLNCSAFQNADPEHLWQCVNGKHDDSTCTPFSVICDGHTRLQLKGDQSNVCSGQLEKEENNKWVPFRQMNSFDVCQQMHCGHSLSPDNKTNVTCTDKVKVVLMQSGKESQCYGTVNIKVNDKYKPVCASSWNKKEAEFVCKELKCGKLIYSTKEPTNSRGIMDHVNCNGSESSLWHCQAQHDKEIPCSSQPYVMCSGSVKVELVDGPGTCAGRLMIKHEGKWKNVANNGWRAAQSATVCKQLECGATGKTEKFSQGFYNVLSIACPANKNISDISECLTADSNRRSSVQEGEAVGITCDGHEVVFLNGSESCSGNVGIEHGSKIYWLSGSKETWNQQSANTVCQQMHCGHATKFTFNSKNDMNIDVWSKSYNCSSREKSLFQCNKTSPPPDHRNSTAYVNCSGKIEMRLENGCWGKVQFSVEGKFGDMCGDTWTPEKSEMLCKNLKCGEALEAHSSPKEGDILFKSLHTTSQTTDLRQSIFIKNQDSDKSYNQKPAYVVCSGSVKPRFSIPSYKCFGNVEVEYEGQWVPVCSDALKDINSQNTICRELKCGDAVEDLPYFGPTPTVKLAISSLTCSADADSLSSGCTSIAISKTACKHTGLKCSEWRTMVPDKKACSGSVLVHSRDGISAVSRETLTKTEKERFCKNMNCGGYQSTNKSQYRPIEIDSFWKKSFNCTGEPLKSIWECEKETPPSRKEPVFIECQGEPSVSLSQDCRGEVRINGSPVCDSNWNLSYKHKVCQEKLCGNAVDYKMPDNRPQSSRNTYHVSCEDYHSILGQCKRTEGKCDTGVVSISCSNSVKFRTSQKNGGFLEVNYRGNWEKICLLSRSEEIEKKLCEEIIKENHGKFNGAKLETALECTDNSMDVKRCVKQRSCGDYSQATIICPDYVKSTPPPPPPPPPSPPTILIIVGVGFLLVVILIFVFIRFRIKRARKSKVSSRMLPGKEVEFESGEYEDVMNKENEMEDFSRGRFRSEAEFISENDGQSISSLPYDDIDEVNEARPLTFSGTTSSAARDINMHEDGVTYEVEEPQESYDDIDTIPETPQTRVEVHDSPQTTHDLNTAAPGLVQRDEDYLEPDQDG